MCANVPSNPLKHPSQYYHQRWELAPLPESSDSVLRDWLIEVLLLKTFILKGSTLYYLQIKKRALLHMHSQPQWAPLPQKLCGSRRHQFSATPSLLPLDVHMWRFGEHASGKKKIKPRIQLGICLAASNRNPNRDINKTGFFSFNKKADAYFGSLVVSGLGSLFFVCLLVSFSFSC